MILAILICTLPNRADKLRRLMSVLQPQVHKYQDKVCIHINDSGASMPTGRKRNELINQSFSDYFVFIDDDDVVTSDYVEQILKAAQSNPDVITFRGWMTTNGRDRRGWTIRLNSRYEERDGHYYRWPNHIVPIRRDSVRGVWFQEIYVQEDYKWSKKIHDMRLLKTEVFIDKELYHYDFYTKPTRLRR